MRIGTFLMAAALGSTLALSPSSAARPRDQDRAYRAMQEGRSMPLPLIERRIVPMMGGADYLGPELRGDTYRLKFVRDGRLIWVDVDAATGRVLGQSGQ